MKTKSEWQGKLKRVVIHSVNNLYVSYSDVRNEWDDNPTKPMVYTCTMKFFKDNYPIKVKDGS